VRVNTPVTFTMHVKNNSNQPATNVMVYDPVPANAIYESITLSPSDPQHQTSLETSQFRGQVVAKLGNLDPNQSVTITLKLSPAALGDLTNRAYVVCDQLNSATYKNIETALSAKPPQAALFFGGAVTGDLNGHPMTFDAGGGTAGTLNWGLGWIGGDTATGLTAN